MYHYKRWAYFGYDGWLENDQHKAEEAYYAGGGTENSYPGSDEIDKTYFINSSLYSPSQPSQKTCGHHPGYYPTTSINGKILYVSNLISISKFKRFIQENPEYEKSRCKTGGKNRADRWDSVNADKDDSLPAAVTWSDAMAYAKWISETQYISVRLLTEEEYYAIAQPVLRPPSIEDLKQEWSKSDIIKSADIFGQNIIKSEQICNFFTPDGSSILGHPAHMPEKEFQALEFRYIPNILKWEQHPSGLKFLSSLYFQEWLDKEGATVNCRTLSSWHPEIPPYKHPFSPLSTGKHKSLKIGFRLCYLGTSQKS